MDPSSRKGEGLRRVLLIPPTAPGSLGDEAMLTAMADRCSARGLTLSCCGYEHADEWSFVRHLESASCLKDFFVSGDPEDARPFLDAAAQSDVVVLIGADVLDGAYSVKRSVYRLRLLDLAASQGARCEVVSCSFKANPKTQCVQAMRELHPSVTFRARDAVSGRRLESVLGRKVQVTADLAFLLPPDTEYRRTAQLVDWIRNKRAGGKIVVGVNVNAHHLNPPDRGSQLLRSYMLAMYDVARTESVAYVLLPHDYRGRESDYTALNRLAMTMCRDGQIAHGTVGRGARAAEIKSIVKELDVVVSGRMHLAIACLGQATPVGCIAYQGKFEGLMQHFELKRVLLTPDHALSPGLLRQLMVNLIARRARIRRQLEERLPFVRDLAALNLPC